MRKEVIKGKTAIINCGFDEIDKQDSRLNYINVREVYKLFGGQSRVGGTDRHTSLKNWRDSRLLWVRDILRKSRTRRTFQGI